MANLHKLLFLIFLQIHFSSNYVFAQKLPYPKINWLLPENDDIEIVDYRFENNVALTKYKNDNNCFKCGLVDKTGKIVIPPTYCGAHYLGEGMYRYNNNNSSAMYFGLFNNTGKLIVQPIYQVINDFNNGIAAVCKNNKWGYINSNGNLITEIKYDKVFDFKEGIGVLVLDNNTTFIDKNGKKIMFSNFNANGSFSNGLCEVWDNNKGKFGYINKMFDLQIECKFNGSFPFKNGYAKVADEKYKLFLIDKNGNHILQNEKGHCETFNDYITCTNTNYSVIKYFNLNLQEYAFTTKPGNLYFFYESLSEFQNDGKFGFLNLDGQIIIQPIFDEVGHFSNGIASVKKGNKWSYINKKGTLLYDFIFDEAHEFNINGAIIKINGRTGLLNNP